MIDLLQLGQINFPNYLIIGCSLLLILPTFITFVLRYCLYRHLHFLTVKVKKLLRGERQGQQPRLIESVEVRFQESNYYQKVNTSAIIKGIYNQEKFNFLGLSLRCESTHYFSGVLPKLLLAFGLFGAFLSITINLASFSQRLNQEALTNGGLLTVLNPSLQSLEVALITSLIAIGCSCFLTVVNLTWNTSTTSKALINYLEDYIDNVYSHQLPSYNPLKESMESLIVQLTNSLANLGNNIQQSIEKSLSKPIQELVEYNHKSTQSTEELYNVLMDALQGIDIIKESALTFEKATQNLEKSRFPEKLSSATTDLAIAQNQFSQSSLVLNKSTQSLEISLDSFQKSWQKIIDLQIELNSLNEKYTTMMSLIQKRNVIEEASLNEIKNELANLVDKLKRT